MGKNIFIWTVGVMLSLLLLDAGTIHSEELPLPPALKEQLKACVTIYVDSSRGTRVSVGRGIVVDNGGIIATSYRLIAKWREARDNSFFVRGGGPLAQLEKIVAIDVENGIALVMVDLQGSPAVKAVRAPDIKDGLKIFVMSDVSGKVPLAFEGTVSGASGRRWHIRTSAAIPKELEGAPVFDAEGEVIGMLSSDSTTEGGDFLLVSGGRIYDLLDQYAELHAREQAAESPSGPPSEKDLGETLEESQARVKQHPGDARAYFLLGWAYVREGMYEDAAAAYSHALELKPDYIDVYNNLGVLYGKNLGRYKDSIDVFKKALKIDPAFAEARYNLGLAYLFSGDRKSAMMQYTALTKNDEERADKLLRFITSQDSEGEARDGPH